MFFSMTFSGLRSQWMISLESNNMVGIRNENLNFTASQICLEICKVQFCNNDENIQFNICACIGSQYTSALFLEF